MSAHEETPKTNPEGRDSNGRFAKGNAGGPGNPFARRVAQMRSLALEKVTDDDLAAILKKMVELAKEGDIPAAKLVLQYTLGKPVSQPHPDRIDRDEMQAWLANCLQPGDRYALAAAPLEVVLAMARVMGPLNGQRFAADLLNGIDRLNERDAQAAVNQRSKPAKPASVIVPPASPITDTESLRLVTPPGEASPKPGRRAANRSLS
ncbi:MAG: hypothetical protein U0797_29445 [Gemmataceae bacterium]